MKRFLHGGEIGLCGDEILFRQGDGFTNQFGVGVDRLNDCADLRVDGRAEIALPIFLHPIPDDLAVFDVVFLHLLHLGAVLAADGHDCRDRIGAEGVVHHVGILLRLQGAREQEHLVVLGADGGKLLEGAGEDHAQDNGGGQGDAENLVADG